MMSDELFMALERIEWYERQYPHIYADLPEVGHCKVVMQALLTALDRSPHYPEFGGMTVGEIRATDVVPVPSGTTYGGGSIKPGDSPPPATLPPNGGGR